MAGTRSTVQGGDKEEACGARGAAVASACSPACGGGQWELPPCTRDLLWPKSWAGGSRDVPSLVTKVIWAGGPQQ